LGVVTPYRIETTPIAPIMKNLPQVLVEPSGVDLSSIHRETIIGAHAGRALVALQLADNTLIWQAILIGSYDIAEIMLEGIDRCYLWVILNGTHAIRRWSYYKEKEG
jgi:hypothetical protein